MVYGLIDNAGLCWLNLNAKMGWIGVFSAREWLGGWWSEVRLAGVQEGYGGWWGSGLSEGALAGCVWLSVGAGGCTGRRRLCPSGRSQGAAPVEG